MTSIDGGAASVANAYLINNLVRSLVTAGLIDEAAFDAFWTDSLLSAREHPNPAVAAFIEAIIPPRLR